MRLLFWKSKKRASPKPEKDDFAQDYTPEDQNAPEEINKQTKPPQKKHKVLAIKNWCDKKLTPLAYARVLIRLLPVIREYDYNFGDLQHPTEDTSIQHDFFLLMKATIKEIYHEEHKDETLDLTLS